MLKFIINLLFVCFFFFFDSIAQADTLTMTDGKKIKGLVVEEYTDRVTLSTIDGEATILRKYIDHIEYDTSEQNFMQLGRAYDEKGWYDKAAFYYKKAMDANPDYKPAREAYLASHAKKWREEEKRTKKELNRRSMIMEWQTNRRKKTFSVPGKGKDILVRESLGISLSESSGGFRITEVRPYSSADRSGIKEGDILVSIWGKLVKHTDKKEVLDELLGPEYSEVKVTVERQVSFPVADDNQNPYESLGVTLGFEYQGLIVENITDEESAAAQVFKRGDSVEAIEGENTRYLSLGSIIEIINNAASTEQNVNFRIRRTLNLRREG